MTGGFTQSLTRLYLFSAVLLSYIVLEFQPNGATDFICFKPEKLQIPDLKADSEFWKQQMSGVDV